MPVDVGMKEEEWYELKDFLGATPTNWNGEAQAIFLKINVYLRVSIVLIVGVGLRAIVQTSRRQVSGSSGAAALRPGAGVLYTENEVGLQTHP